MHLLGRLEPLGFQRGLFPLQACHQVRTERKTVIPRVSLRHHINLLLNFWTPHHLSFSQSSLSHPQDESSHNLQGSHHCKNNIPFLFHNTFLVTRPSSPCVKNCPSSKVILLIVCRSWLPHFSEIHHVQQLGIYFTLLL